MAGARVNPSVSSRFTQWTTQELLDNMQQLWVARGRCYKSWVMPKHVSAPLGVWRQVVWITRCAASISRERAMVVHRVGPPPASRLHPSGWVLTIDGGWSSFPEFIEPRSEQLSWDELPFYDESMLHKMLLRNVHDENVVS